MTGLVLMKLALTLGIASNLGLIVVLVWASIGRRNVLPRKIVWLLCLACVAIAAAMLIAGFLWWLWS